MRLRLLLPRSGRRRGLGGLALAAASALLAAGCGGSDKPRSLTAATVQPPTLPTPKPAAPAPPRLGIGLTEFNPNLFNHDLTPPAFAPWRDRLEALRPRWFRLVVQWDTAAPTPTAAPAFNHLEDGCVRGLPPCAPFDGVRARLRAIASQQRAHPGLWKLLVVFTYAPRWAAVGPHGCEHDPTDPRARAVDTEALPGYRNLIRSLLAEAAADGAKVSAVSPWNEPNHPSFISPQRAACDAHSPLLSPAIYTRFARAARDELKGTKTQLVLGELAGKVEPSSLAGGVDEFVRALPGDVACAGAIWSQHMYTDLPYDPNFAGPVGQLERALDARPCTKGKPIWVTETGVGATHAGRKRSADPAQLQQDCRAQAAALRRWSRDDRIQNVFQYEFRDAPDFPVGLADPGLTRTYPVYGVYRRASREGKYSC